MILEEETLGSPVRQEEADRDHLPDFPLPDDLLPEMRDPGHRDLHRIFSRTELHLHVSGHVRCLSARSAP